MLEFWVDKALEIYELMHQSWNKREKDEITETEHCFNMLVWTEFWDNMAEELSAYELRQLIDAVEDMIYIEIENEKGG